MNVFSNSIDTIEDRCGHEDRRVSVLISTYARETASNLKESLESIYSQSVPPDQMVLVVDGSIGEEQEQVIAEYASDCRIADVIVLRLLSNRGLARALNVGLEHCTGQYVMRADSDDICEPQRLELQLNYLNDHPDTDVISTWVREFFVDGTPDMIKTCPSQNDEIIRALRWRCVIAHPTVLIRTATLRRIGGYSSAFGKLEDYDLFVRLVVSGAKFYAIPQPLVRMRTSLEQRQRRGGLRLCLNEVRFRMCCFRLGFLNIAEFVSITSLYVLFRLLGGSLRQYLYRFVRSSDTATTFSQYPSSLVVSSPIESELI